MKLATFLFAVTAWAQLQPPQLGVMIDANGAARPVLGVAGSVTLGDPVAGGVLASACSSKLCLYKTRSAILYPGGQAPAPEGSALFALNGTSAFVYFPRTGELAEWSNGTLTALDRNGSGEILSLGVTADGQLEFAVLEDGAISIVDNSGDVLAAVPGAGPVMLLGGDVLYADSGSLVLRRGDGSELRWPLPSMRQFSALGDGYVQIQTEQGSFALRVIAGREQFFQLPEPRR